MELHSFIDLVLPRFSTINWQNGASIFRAGGVSQFQAYGELFSAKVRSGIGENYEVRIRLHAKGAFIQWMECTCQANRKKAEQCPHLVAFCIYLDQEKSEYLTKMNFETGNSSLYLNPVYQHETQVELTEKKKLDLTDVKEKWDAINDAKDILKGNHLQNALSKETTNLLSIELAEGDSEPYVNALIQIEGHKTLNYRLGIDDTCKLLFNEKYLQKASAKIHKLIDHKIVAKRNFFVHDINTHELLIQRNITLFKKDNSKPYKQIPVNDVEHFYIGKIGFFVKNIGYIPFVDNLNYTQISRWNEYPATTKATGEIAATLIDTDFSHLKETAEVVLKNNAIKTSIYDKFALPEFSIKETSGSKVLIDTKFEFSSDGVDKKDFSGTLLQILRARQEDKKYLKTKSGFAKISSEFDWLQNKVLENGQLELSTLEFIRFFDQFGKESKAKGKNDFIEKIRTGLIAREKLELPSLKNTNLSLRPYQEEGLKWLWWLYTNSLGGLLADEMGLGKTHQAMGLLASIANKEKNSLSLVICPTSVIDHWLDKIRQYVPMLKTFCYHGTARKEYLFAIQNHPNNHYVLVTSYGILLRDIPLLMRYQWNIVILDEAQLVKNQSSLTYRAACKIESKMRLCLTGTPMENDLLELKNLFDYITPHYLGSDAEFKKKYMSTEVKDAFLADLDLHRLIYPFKLRRAKQDVLTDLPDKVEDYKYCHLNASQKKLYSEVLALKGSKLVGELENDKMPVPYIHIFSLISLLKQICDDPALIDPRYEDLGSGKLQVLDELLSEALESEQKVVVFTQYAKMVSRLSSHLNKRGIKHVTLTGESQKRGQIVQEFQGNKEVKVFIGSLLAGGVGIDLTAANVVIHFDRWWNAAKENQATDRIHRIGQTRNVQVYKLVTRGTLEERIDEIITRKKIIFDRFVEQSDETFKSFSREDLLQLLKAPNDSVDLDPQDDEIEI